MSYGKKIWRNTTSGILNQLITLAVGILIPRLVLVSLGSEANGLLGSTNQAITYLALLEGGMGLSITQALYGPMASEKHDDINGIMSASNLFYQNVGTWYFVGLMIVAVIYSMTVKTSLSNLTVFAVVLLTGLPQVINFFFQGKYRTLISVSGRGYVLSNLNTVVYIGQSICKVVLLLCGFGLVAIQVMYCVVSLIQMIFIIRYVKKVFPWLDLTVEPQKERIGQRSSVFVHQISGFIFSNTDMLLLTYFCNLMVVSVYSMYTMFFSMVGTLISNITGSVIFVMGQTFNTDREKYLKLQNAFETFNMILVFSCYFVLCQCILPFLRLYTAGITDINYIDPYIPYLFTAIQLLQTGRYSSQKVIEYAGEFRNTQWHAAVELALNVVISVVGVIHWGIYGVLVGTIISLGFRSVMMIYYACKKILNIKQTNVYKKWLINIVLFVVMQYIISNMGYIPKSYLTVVLYAAMMMVVALIVFGTAGLLYDKNSIRLVIGKILNH